MVSSSDAVYPPSTHLLPSILLPSEPTTHGQSMPSADPCEAWLSSMDLMTLAQPVVLITVEEMWRNVVEETNNRNHKGDKVPLRDNRGATHGKVYLRSLIQLGLRYPPFWFSTLESKKAMLILLEGNLRTSYLKKRGSSYPPSSHTQLSHWISQLATWRDMLSSLIDSLTPRIDSSIESHIHPRSRHWLSRTSCVSFASGCMGSQFAILNSVKRTAMVPRIFPTNLVESINTGYKPDRIYSKPPNYTLHLVTTAGRVFAVNWSLEKTIPLSPLNHTCPLLLALQHSLHHPSPQSCRLLLLSPHKHCPAHYYCPTH